MTGVSLTELWSLTSRDRDERERESTLGMRGLGCLMGASFRVRRGDDELRGDELLRELRKSSLLLDAESSSPLKLCTSFCPGSNTPRIPTHKTWGEPGNGGHKGAQVPGSPVYRSEFHRATRPAYEELPARVAPAWRVGEYY